MRKTILRCATLAILFLALSRLAVCCWIDTHSHDNLLLLSLYEHIAPDWAIPMAVKQLGNQDRKMRGAADSVLSRIGVRAIPAVNKALQSECPRRRAAAAQSLWRMLSPYREESIRKEIRLLSTDVLQKALKDEDAQVRIAAALAYWRLFPKKQIVIQILAEGVTDENHDVVYAATNGIAEIGPPAEAALPALHAKMKDADWIVQSWVKRAINAIE